jgi:hypothetical protein
MSYTILRNGIGALGLALPFLLIGGAGLDHVQASLSAYYHFSPSEPQRYGAGVMRDVFVGLLFAIGAFLLFHRDLSRGEDIALNIAGVAAVLIAIFPMDWPSGQARVSLSSTVHSLAAATFFVMIAYVCVFSAHYTLSLVADRARRRLFRKIYLVFGALMVLTPATVFALSLAVPPGEDNRSTLIVEVGGVLVFASFWLVKSFEIRTALRPGPRPRTRAPAA